MAAEEKKPSRKKSEESASAKKTSGKSSKVRETRKSVVKTAAKKTAAKKSTTKKAATTAKAAATTAKKKSATAAAKPVRRAAPGSGAAPESDVTEAALRDMQAKAEDTSVEDVEALKYGSETSQKPELYPAGRLPGPRELDRVYGDTKLVLLVRDPEWIFAYWEIGPDARKELNIPRGDHGRTMVMRWYDVTGVPEFDGQNALDMMDVQVNDIAISWYQKMPRPDRSWCADLGFYDETGAFVAICRSQIVHTPRNTVSPPGKGEVWAKADELRLQQIFEASGSKRVPASLGSEGAVSSERLVR